MKYYLHTDHLIASESERPERAIFDKWKKVMDGIAPFETFYNKWLQSATRYEYGEGQTKKFFDHCIEKYGMGIYDMKDFHDALSEGILIDEGRVEIRIECPAGLDKYDGLDYFAYFVPEVKGEAGETQEELWRELYHVIYGGLIGSWHPNILERIKSRFTITRK